MKWAFKLFDNRICIACFFGIKICVLNIVLKWNKSHWIPNKSEHFIINNK